MLNLQCTCSRKKYFLKGSSLFGSRHQRAYWERMALWTREKKTGWVQRCGSFVFVFSVSMGANGISRMQKALGRISVWGLADIIGYLVHSCVGFDQILNHVCKLQKNGDLFPFLCCFSDSWIILPPYRHKDSMPSALLWFHLAER